VQIKEKEKDHLKNGKHGKVVVIRFPESGTQRKGGRKHRGSVLLPFLYIKNKYLINKDQ